MQDTSFKIKNEKFEGPLALLLELIEKRKLLINEFSLAQITDDYIAHMQQAGEQSIGHQTDFILVASTLLLIKSRSLLPELTLSHEEESDIVDLERRLVLFKRIKELSIHVKDLFLGEPLFFAKDRKGVKVIFTPDPKITLATMSQSFGQALEKIPKPKEEVKATIKKTISIEEMMDSLTERVQKAIRLSFKEFTGGNPKNKEEKVTVIVGFLALLEMVKQGVAQVRQDNTFDDIIVETESISIPNYQ